MRTISLNAVLLIGLTSSTASAQTITITPRNNDALSVAAPATAKRETIRVTVTLQSQLPVSSGANAEEQMRVGDEARRKVYETTDRECATLRDVYNADCKLLQLSVNSAMQDRGGNGAALNTSGNATYELTLRERPAQP